MGLDVEGLGDEVGGRVVNIVVSHERRLVKLAQKPPREELLELVLPDLQCTEEKRWWVGRP